MTPVLTQSRLKSRLDGLAPRVLIAAVTFSMLAACAPPRPLPKERVPNIVSAESSYNYHAARNLLGQATLDEQRGNTGQALDGYRQAATTWPGLTKAWRGVARTTDQQDEQEAARFIAARTRLVEPNDILTQRQMAQALRTYLDDQRAGENANPMTLSYAAQLASFYDDLYATRGTYEEPRAFGNIRPNEIPTAIITGVGTSIYLGVVLTGD